MPGAELIGSVVNSGSAATEEVHISNISLTNDVERLVGVAMTMESVRQILEGLGYRLKLRKMGIVSVCRCQQLAPTLLLKKILSRNWPVCMGMTLLNLSRY